MSNGQRRAEGKKARTSRLVPILVFFRSTLSDFFPPLFFFVRASSSPSTFIWRETGARGVEKKSRQGRDRRDDKRRPCTRPLPLPPATDGLTKQSVLILMTRLAPAAPEEKKAQPTTHMQGALHTTLKHV